MSLLMLIVSTSFAVVVIFVVVSVAKKKLKWRVLQFIEGAIFCYLFFPNPIKLKMLWILAVIHFYFPSNHKVWVHNLTKAASMDSSNAIMHSHNNILQEPGIHLKIFSCFMWTKLNRINLQDKKKVNDVSKHNPIWGSEVNFPGLKWHIWDYYQWMSWQRDFHYMFTLKKVISCSCVAVFLQQGNASKCMRRSTIFPSATWHYSGEFPGCSEYNIV